MYFFEFKNLINKGKPTYPNPIIATVFLFFSKFIDKFIYILFKDYNDTCNINKKKQFHFFLLSILVSAVITFFLNIYIDKNKETFTENCSKYLLLNIENKYNSQILNNYVNIVFEREKLNLKLKFDDIDIQTNKIFTKNGSDCEKKSNFILMKLKILNYLLKIN